MTPHKENKSETQDATLLLKADHERVSDLFADYEDSDSVAEKRQIAEQICDELTVHAQIEEEIFYPAVKQALNDKALIPEARVEHATLKTLISEVQGMEPNGEMFDAKIKVMSEYVKHHVKEEQNEIFPKAKSAGVDMMKLGAKLAERKQQLRGASHR